MEKLLNQLRLKLEVVTASLDGNRHMLHDNEIRQINTDIQRINYLINCLGPDNEKLVDTFKYYLHKFNVIRSAVNKRYNGNNVSFTDAQLLDPYQYIALNSA